MSQDACWSGSWSAGVWAHKSGWTIMYDDDGYWVCHPNGGLSRQLSGNPYPALTLAKRAVETHLGRKAGR